ncbi:hypothetical protein GCM10027570_53700 [Streptomonospora sediminis]
MCTRAPWTTIGCGVSAAIAAAGSPEWEETGRTIGGLLRVVADILPRTEDIPRRAKKAEDPHFGHRAPRKANANRTFMFR